MIIFFPPPGVTLYEAKARLLAEGYGKMVRSTYGYMYWMPQKGFKVRIKQKNKLVLEIRYGLPSQLPLSQKEIEALKQEIKTAGLPIISP